MIVCLFVCLDKEFGWEEVVVGIGRSVVRVWKEEIHDAW